MDNQQYAFATQIAEKAQMASIRGDVAQYVAAREDLKIYIIECQGGSAKDAYLLADAMIR